MRTTSTPSWRTNEKKNKKCCDWSESLKPEKKHNAIDGRTIEPSKNKCMRHGRSEDLS